MYKNACLNNFSCENKNDYISTEIVVGKVSSVGKVKDTTGVTT